MIGKTKNSALTQYVGNTRKEMHKYKETDLKYDLAREFLEWNNSEDELTTAKPPGYIIDTFFPNRLNTNDLKVLTTKVTHALMVQ